MIDPRPPLRFIAPLLGLLTTLAGPPAPSAAQVHWENDFRLTYEYDDNVREEVEDEVKARVARFALKSDLVWDDSTTQQLSLLYQGSFKSYFDVERDSLDISDQFLNEGQVSYQRRFSASELQVSAGIKDRTWSDSDFFFVNEDGFTRLWGGLGLRRSFSPTFSGEVAAAVSGIDFDHVDEFFGYDAQSLRLGVAKRLSEDVVGDAYYVLEQRTYDGRAKLRGPDDDPANISAPDRPRQIDLAHESSIGLAIYGRFGFQARYRYRLNDSNSFGFDYYSHILNIQLAQQLPWRMIAQFYGNVELRKFREAVQGLAGTLDVEDTDNNVMVLRLLKEINGHFDIEARYGYYRNESINLDDFYNKHTYSLGFRVRP
jgi:hypothetical protein